VAFGEQAPRVGSNALAILPRSDASRVPPKRAALA